MTNRKIIIVSWRTITIALATLTSKIAGFLSLTEPKTFRVKDYPLPSRQVASLKEQNFSKPSVSQ